MTLSAVIIAKNEEEVVEEALKSVQFANEIVVVDSFSTDTTSDIARKYRTTVIENEFKNYADQRNFAKEKTNGDWILYLDADERVTPTLKEEIKNVINNNPNESAFFIPRENYYLGRKWPTNDKIQRLFKKNKLVRWEGELHESPLVDGNFGVLKNPLIHLTHRDLKSMLEKTVIWSEKEAELRLKANHPKMTTWRFLRVMFTEFFNYFIRQKGYKAGTEGWIESTFQAFSIFITYARLWEMQRKGMLKDTYRKTDKNNG